MKREPLIENSRVRANGRNQCVIRFYQQPADITAAEVVAMTLSRWRHFQGGAGTLDRATVPCLGERTLEYEADRGRLVVVPGKLRAIFVSSLGDRESAHLDTTHPCGFRF
jgi:hypothetical protein